eukprot:jgi/Bigna1/132093/aug1.16_g6801
MTLVNAGDLLAQVLVESGVRDVYATSPSLSVGAIADVMEKAGATLYSHLTPGTSIAAAQARAELTNSLVAIVLTADDVDARTVTAAATAAAMASPASQNGTSKSEKLGGGGSIIRRIGRTPTGAEATGASASGLLLLLLRERVKRRGGTTLGREAARKVEETATDGSSHSTSFVEKLRKECQDIVVMDFPDDNDNERLGGHGSLDFKANESVASSSSSSLSHEDFELLQLSSEYIINRATIATRAAVTAPASSASSRSGVVLIDFDPKILAALCHPISRQIGGKRLRGGAHSSSSSSSSSSSFPTITSTSHTATVVIVPESLEASIIERLEEAVAGKGRGGVEGKHVSPLTSIMSAAVSRAASNSSLVVVPNTGVSLLGYALGATGYLLPQQQQQQQQQQRQHKGVVLLAVRRRDIFPTASTPNDAADDSDTTRENWSGSNTSLSLDALRTAVSRRCNLVVVVVDNTDDNKVKAHVQEEKEKAGLDEELVAAALGIGCYTLENATKAIDSARTGRPCLLLSKSSKTGKKVSAILGTREIKARNDKSMKETTLESLQALVSVCPSPLSAAHSLLGIIKESCNEKREEKETKRMREVTLVTSEELLQNTYVLEFMYNDDDDDDDADDHDGR